MYNLFQLYKPFYHNYFLNEKKNILVVTEHGGAKCAAWRRLAEPAESPPSSPLGGGGGGLRLWDCERVPIILICEIAEATPPPPSKAVGAVRGCWPYWSYWRDCQHITIMKVDKTRTMLTHYCCQWTCAPASYIYVDTIQHSASLFEYKSDK